MEGASKASSKFCRTCLGRGVNCLQLHAKLHGHREEASQCTAIQGLQPGKFPHMTRMRIGTQLGLAGLHWVNYISGRLLLRVVPLTKTAG